ncbi:MAG: hypothetical protein ACUZ8I_02100 [Candidatus Scalindua sp.]
MNGKLYNVESLNQEMINIIQEMIDNWKVKDVNKLKKDHQKTRNAKSKKTIRPRKGNLL